jgi:hypothetical protein
MLNYSALQNNKIERLYLNDNNVNQGLKFILMER